MQCHPVGYRIKGFYREARLGDLWDMTTQDARERRKILDFAVVHGKAAVSDAFAVSVRTLYRWKAALNHAGGRD